MRYLPVLLLLVTLAACKREETQSVRIDPALATLIPAGTNVLVGIRMEEVRKTPVYQKWLANRPMPGADEIAKETGIDPKKDIWEVLVASGPSGSVALARGKFSEQGMEPDVRREGLTRTPYKGFTLIGNDEGAVVFINPETAAVGRPEMVRAVIDQRNSGAAGRALLDLAKAIPHGTQIWMATTGGLSGREIPKTGNLANLGNLAGLIENATAAVNLGTGVNTKLDALCRTPEDAKKLNDTVRGLTGMARLMTPDNQRDLLKAYDAIQVEQKDRTVRVTADLPQQVVDSLAANFQNWRPRIPAGQ